MPDKHWSEHKPWDKWTDKEKLFVHEYRIDNCGKDAAVRAGYSAKTAVKIAAELLQKPHIRGWLDEHIAKKCEKLDVTVERIVQELALVGFQNIAGAFNADNSLKSIADMPEDIQRVISGIDIDELFEGRGEDREHIGYTKKLRAWNKLDALKLLGQHLKMFTDKIEITDNRPKVVRRDLTGKKNKASE